MHLALFIATLVSMIAMYVALPVMWEVGTGRHRFAAGVQYAFALTAILGAHEMGHYVACRLYRVRVTLPYFLPAPFTLFGTFGAVIRIGGRLPSRRALFDIAVAGPIAGLVVAIPVLVWGLEHSRITVLAPAVDQLRLGEPLLLKWLIATIVGSVGPGTVLAYHPAAFAGWAGLFVTALNLLPAGQLDGGHILYALWGERTRFVGVMVAVALVALAVVTKFYGWVLFASLLVLMGLRHPPTGLDDSPLGPFRRRLGVLMIFVWFLLFSPVPIVFG